MCEDDGGGVQFQAAFYHFARVHAGAVDGAGEQNLAVDDAVPVIQEHARKHLVRVAAQPGFDVGLGLVRIAQHGPGAHLRLQVAPPQFQGGL